MCEKSCNNCAYGDRSSMEHPCKVCSQNYINKWERIRRPCDGCVYDDDHSNKYCDNCTRETQGRMDHYTEAD
ncbi:hypothetical protein [Hominibacterium faecale]|uniref:hypothetical protein n=1 Tax=Hominibacterium faecale TaxID=2839743 RepID=UPI0022B2A53F|nr:hypothetical protein [Hominibacterium faecale]